jgi:hypothetical protein
MLEYEGKGDVVGDVDKPISQSSLNDYVPTSRPVGIEALSSADA